MNTLSIKRFGLAFGTTGALLHIGCIALMAILGKEESVRFFNSLIHGVDFSPIIRASMPPVEMLIGVFEVFILGWLVGATVASLYNLGAKNTICLK